MKVWVVKYWDTKGIYQAEGKTISGKDTTHLFIPSRSITGINVRVYLGDTAFIEKADAKARALVLRDRKLASLRKKIAKLEKMEL